MAPCIRLIGNREGALVTGGRIDGKLTTVAASPDVPEARVCSVLRWMDGRIHAAAPRPVHLYRLGDVMARLHDHAARWRVPPGFVRIRWDWETFFGDTMVYGGIGAADVWELLPDDLRRRFARVASGMRRVMSQLGEGADNVGLIHADMHLGNALFWRGEVRVIDFDDCGFGYWLYDIAVPLWELRHRNDYGHFRSALIDGYTRRRPLPPGCLAHLDDFIAALRGRVRAMVHRHRASQPGLPRRPRSGPGRHRPLAGHPAPELKRPPPGRPDPIRGGAKHGDRRRGTPGPDPS